MRKRIFGLVICIALFAGCNGSEKDAKARLDNARMLYERNELMAAKSEIDSIRFYHPKEAGVLREALNLMRQVEYKEAERNILFCDSLLPIRQEEAARMRKAFVFEKDSVYEEIGNYIWKQQTLERNVERSYIRCGVNEKGEMYLASVYFGSAPINHTGIKVSTKDGLFAETASIPYDGGVNYRFKDLGNTSEIVNYKGENGMDAVKFIYSNTNTKERIKVDYIGGKPFGIYMDDAGKKAVVATYELASILSDVENLTNERDKAIKKKAYLEDKLGR
jgi:hypothetical protein